MRADVCRLSCFLSRITQIMEYIKTGMTFEEFLIFQKETGLTDDKIKTMTAAELKEAIGKYQKQK